MSKSTSNIICTNGSTIKDNSELNVFNKMPLNVEQTRDTDENMKISDDESTVTIGEISVDEYYDDIIRHGKQLVHAELYCTDQNEQSGSSNNVNIVNNEDSDNDEENLEGESLIVNDICLALPTIIQVHRHNRAHIRENAHNHTNEQVNDQAREHTRVQPTHHQNYEHTLGNRVCYRQACNDLVMPVKPRNKPRAAAVEAAAKIAKSGTKRKRSYRKINSTKIYYSCGHREKIGGTSLKHIGIKTPMIVKESRLLDDRLMKTTFFLLKLPAEPTVHQILSDFQRKANLSPEVMDLIFTAFNHAIPAWCLYFIEKLQYDEIIMKYPNRQVSELYGLAHLLRFIVSLPRLYYKMKPYNTQFNKHVTAFMNKLMDYLVAEDLQVDIEKDYEHAMPEYHRLTYWSIHNQR